MIFQKIRTNRITVLDTAAAASFVSSGRTAAADMMAVTGCGILAAIVVFTVRSGRIDDRPVVSYFFGNGGAVPMDQCGNFLKGKMTAKTGLNLDAIIQR